MAYGIKYRHTYCNEYGVNSTVTILENGYSGVIKEIDAQEDPIVISQEGSDTNKFDTIRPSTASIGLIGSDTFKLEELFTADERKYMVENHVGGVMVWRGFVIPNGFSHEWTGGEFPMEIIASDNLSTLKDFPFLNDNGTVISGRLNHIDILLKCLNKLDIGIDLLTLTNIARQGGVAGEDPLFINTTDAYTFLNTNVREEGIDFYYENPENAFNCEDVVNAICRLYGAKIYQSKGQWRFKRVNVDYGASISGQEFHRYNTLGVKIGTVSYDEVITIPCNDYSGIKAQYSGALMSMSEVYKSAQSRYKYRYLTVGDELPPIIKNQELDGLNSPALQFIPYDWTLEKRIIHIPPRDRQLNIQSVSDYPSESIGSTLRIWGVSNGDSLVSAPLNIPSLKKDDRARLSVWFKPPKFLMLGGYSPFYVTLRIVFMAQSRRWELKPDSTFSWDTPPEKRNKIGSNWVEIPRSNNGSFPAAKAFPLPNTVNDRTIESPEWNQCFISIPPSPEDGYVSVEFSGVGLPEDMQSKPTDGVTGTTIRSYVFGAPFEPATEWRDGHILLYSQEYRIGSLQIGRIIGNSSSGRIYTSEQNDKYTQQGSQVPLLTSDVEDKNTISGILTLGNFVDKWNDSLNPYSEFKPLGLMLTRDIMRQYKNVWRVIEEDIKANGLSFDTTIEFEERPGERYVIQRGAISQKFNRLIGCTLIQVSANPDTAFIGSETIDEDFSSSGGSGGGSGGGGSGGGGGSAPQDLQSVTDIGAETTNIITAKGVRAETLLEIPDHAPLAPDIEEDKNYLWIGSWGDSSPVPPSPGAQYFVDLLDVVKPLASGFIKFDQHTGLVYSDPNGGGGGGDATEEWVEINFSPIGHIHAVVTTAVNGFMSAGDKAKLNGIAANANNYIHPAKTWVDKSSLTGDVVISNITVDSLGHPTGWTTRSLSASDLGALTQALADGRYSLLGHTHTIAQITGLQAELNGKESAFSKNTAFNKNFGTTPNTVAEGNHTHDSYVTLATKQKITAEKQFSAAIGIPSVAPVSPEAGINYLWIGDWGESAIIPPDPIPPTTLKFSSFIELEESESMTLTDEHNNAYIFCPEDGQVTVSNSFPVLGSATFQTQYGITLIFPAGHAVQWNGGSLTNGGSMMLYNGQNDFIIASLNRLSANRWSIDGM